MEKSDKKKLPALLCCLLLGYLGVHRFYVGKKITAALFIIVNGLNTLWVTSSSLRFKFPDYNVILFLSSVILTLWIIFDAIFIITGNFTDSQGKTLKDWN